MMGHSLGYWAFFISQSVFVGSVLGWLFARHAIAKGAMRYVKAELDVSEARSRLSLLQMQGDTLTFERNRYKTEAECLREVLRHCTCASSPSRVRRLAYTGKVPLNE